MAVITPLLLSVCSLWRHLEAEAGGDILQQEEMDQWPLQYYHQATSLP
jgi:hypothetical protein